jgi:ATP-binding cassette subfamily B multidrug efflux pump
MKNPPKAAAIAPSPHTPATRAERLLAQFHEEAPIASQRVDWQMLRDLLPYARPHAKLYLTSLLLMPIGVVTTVFLPRLLQRAVDSVGGGRSVDVLTGVALTYLALVIVRFSAGFTETYTMQLAGQRTMGDLRVAVFSHIQKLSIRHFDRTPVGRIVTRITNDIDAMGELFASGAITAIGDVLLLIGVVASMLALDVRLSLVAFAVLPFLALAVETFRRMLRVAQRKIRMRTAQLNAFLNEQVQGIHVVQAFSREAECDAAYYEVNDGYRQANVEQIKADAMMFSVVDAIGTVCVGLVLWFAARRIGLFQNPAEAEAYKGTFVAFYAYIQQFFVPVRDISTKYTMIQSAFASAERIFGLLSVSDFDAPKVEGPFASGDAGTVLELRDVTFRYKSEGPWVLDNVSLKVDAGEMVAIVGATGAGKTTVAGLLQRFYDVDQGAVLVHGRDVRAYERHDLRARFAFVQQDVFMFGGDLLANVALGDDHPDRARAEQALERVGALALFRDRGGIDMPIGERGGNLSAGERQLVAFARALYRDPEVLILDEATANIDSETEARLQGAVDTLLSARTAIVIAHRLSTIRRADRIVVFHRGHIVEQGSHAQLLAAGGVYAKLYQLQFAAEEASSASLPPAEAALGA